ncbi:MAG: bifunctional phosphopantothenoylcysteine decarboxylase/phosphopantothenate synthase [Candidatus Kapabacteria bacterium]|nr:bifunctional phosphopantothenoylcysteine decarboxylase/phosphopantothenate synthase [Candidatus Kapabacteria bacterium]
MANILKNKRIIVGITGSIAAYKIPYLVRELVKNEAIVNVVLTPSAKNFVTEITLANLSRNPVICEMFDLNAQKGGAWHIHLAHEADLMIIAPCSASTLSKLASGLCDNSLTTIATALPLNVPLLVAPAMDSTMFESPATQRNINILKSDGVIIIPPEEGELSSGLVGIGRLPEPDILLEKIIDVLEKWNYTDKKTFNEQKLEKATTETPNEKDKNYEQRLKEALEKNIPSLADSVEKDKWSAELEFTNLKRKLSGDKNYMSLAGKKVLISAGPTIEKIDDVRYISNFSSGKMGYALAEVAKDLGAEVLLVSGPVNITAPENVNLIKVTSAQEMFETILSNFSNYDIIIMSAAVADYTPAEKTEGKIKKKATGDKLILELKSTNDILAEIGKNKTNSQFLVGFALESENEIQNGWIKMKEKNCDMMVVNSANVPDSGFGSDDNTITVLRKDGKEISYQKLPKKICSLEIFKNILELTGNNQ